MTKKLNIILLDTKENMSILNYLIKKSEYNIIKLDFLNNNTIDLLEKADVLIIYKVKNFNLNFIFDLIDYFLLNGKEIICIKENNQYITRYLIKNGCICI